MKKMIFFIPFLRLLIRTSGQQQTSPAHSTTKTDYLQKSKNQKIAAWIFLGGGTIMMITGGVIWSNAVEDNVLTTKGTGILVSSGDLTAISAHSTFFI